MLLIPLILCILSNVACFMSSADFIRKSDFDLNISVIPCSVIPSECKTNSLHPNQARHFVVPDQDPNC